MGIGVLGPLEIDGAATTLAPRDRVVLMALALRPGATISAETLADALWGEDQPTSWPKVVQGCIVRLRKVFGTERIETLSGGYRLLLPRDEFDHQRFEQHVERAHELLARGEPDRAAHLAGEALSLWRGEPFQELIDWDAGRIQVERLTEFRHDAEDLLVEARLKAGHPHGVIGEARRLVSEAPLREARWATLALAQYRAGQQAEALHTIRRARAVLLRELGLDPGPELVELERAILRHDPSLAAQIPLPRASPDCPYPGLPAYDVGDADAFFGRDADVFAALRRLQHAGVLTIVGPSGCGKSSLARAGVAAALRREGRRVVLLSPGTHPSEVLAGLASATSVLVVDQLEEVLSPQVHPAERDQFFRTLLDRSSGGLVFTLRADRLGELAAYPDFAHLLERGFYLLGGMDAESLRQAIEGPASSAGLRLEPGLTDLLVREVEGLPGALPLLSHALRETWARREGQTLTVAGYRSTGGIQEAVAKTAEELYRRSGPGERSTLRDLMLRLITVSAEGNPTRARARRRQVLSDSAHAELVEQMVRARLLSSDEETVEIAHEALVQGWPRLRSWLDEDVDGQRIMRHLAVAADTWEQMGRPEGELYRGARQVRAAEWRQRTHPTLTPAERTFLDAADKLAEREQQAMERQVRYQRRVNRRLVTLLAVGALLLVAALCAGILAIRSAGRATSQATAAEARRLGAQALIAPDSDTSMLLAVEGVRLDDSSDTRANLMAALTRSPLLVGSAESAPLVDLAVNPVKNQVAVSGGPGLVYDGRTLKRLGRYAQTRAAGVAFSPDGDQLAMTVNPYSPSGMDYHEPHPVRILDSRTWQPARTQLGGIPRGHTAEYALGYSADGTRFAVAMENWTDNTTQIIVWDTRQPTRPLTKIDPSGWVESLALSPRGDTVAVMLHPGGWGPKGWLIRAYDVRTGERLGQAGPFVSTQWSDLEMSPDGRTLAAEDGDAVVLLDTATMHLRARLHGHVGAVTSMAFSPDGRLLATGSADHSVVVWSTKTHDALHKLEGHSGLVSNVGFSADSRTVYAVGFDRRLLAWDLGGSRRFVPERHVTPLPRRPVTGRASPDAAKVAYLMDVTPNEFAVQDIATGHLLGIARTHQSSWTPSLAWSPDGRRVATFGNDGSVELWDAATLRLVEKRHVWGEKIFAVAFSSDGKDLLVGSDTGRLIVLDSASLRPRTRALRLEGRRVVSALASRARGAELLIGEGKGGAGALRRVNMSTHQVEESLRLPWVPYSIALSPDGRRAAVGGSHGDVGLLDTATLQWVLPPFHAHKDSVWTVVFSPGGERFVSATSGLVNLWNGHTAEFEGSMQPSVVDQEPGVTFANRGHEVLVTTPDGAVASWDIRTSTWTKEACRIAGRNLTKAEWREYLPDLPYHETCPDAPAAEHRLRSVD